jgi:predicted nuclease of predicted toxin-antitoxin system
VLKLYMDEHVGSAITAGLRRAGVDVLTAREDGHNATPDAILLQRATDLGRLLFTSDRDFLSIAAERQAAGVPFAGVVYANSRDVSIGRCITDLRLIAEAGTPDDHRNVVTRLPF